MIHILFLAATLAVSAAPVPTVTPSPSHRAKQQSAGSAPRSDELFSLRARRRFAAYIRMRLLEMREAGLARAAEAVERDLPVDQLVPRPR